MSIDPFQPPKADLDGEVRADVPVERGPMPGTVIATIVIVSLYAAVALIQLAVDASVGAALRLVVTGIVILGLARGHALAWQWGIVLPTLASLGVAVLLFGAVANPRTPHFVIAVMAAMLAILVSVPILLSLRPSKIFFGLGCPKCGAARGRAASFLFTKRRCAACKFLWTPISR